MPCSEPVTFGGHAGHIGITPGGADEHAWKLIHLSS
jgi:hypothetical protein